MDKIGEKIGFFAILFTMMSISSSPHPFVLIISYIIHELGHLICAKICGVGMSKFKVGSFHLSISYDCSSVSYQRELLVCAGGVLFNFTVAFLSFLLGVTKNETSYFFITCNLSLAIMNLYPISTLDGGGIVKCVTMLVFSESIAMKISKAVSFVAVFILWLCAVYLQLVFNSNISLFFISVFLLIELCFSE